MKPLGNDIYECEYCKQLFQEIQASVPPQQNLQQQASAPHPQQFVNPTHSVPMQGTIMPSGYTHIDNQSIPELEENNEDEMRPLTERPLAMICVVIGWGCIIFGIIDFCGNFGHYDLTGVPWSPIAAGLIGEFFKDYLANKLDV